MGRKKKERLEVSAESIVYVKNLIKEYPRIKENCDYIEHRYPHILQRYGINPTIFQSDSLPCEEQFRDPKECGADYSMVAAYIEQREKVYLLEHSINILNGLEHEVAVELFLKHRSWNDIISSLCISRMTLDRSRNLAICSIAKEIDEYMIWKVEKQFL